MPAQSKIVESQTAPARWTSEPQAEELFHKQRAYFASDATKSYEWRFEQLDRLSRMLKDNYQRFSEASRQDFKSASQENLFEVSASIATAEYTKSQVKDWMKPVEAPLPKFLAASGHKGMVYREPYGVTLIICPFNGPLLLSLRPAIGALAAGNHHRRSPGTPFGVIFEGEFVGCKSGDICAGAWIRCGISFSPCLHPRDSTTHRC
jgi:acyl-CoA reductase-like NAD-dependent aldehyde dehydrogenase